MKNYPIFIETGVHAGKTVWVSRSMAVTGIVFCKIKDEWCILANKRGKNAPDFQGMWNMPCGYLDWDETLLEACVREIKEETGVDVNPTKLTLLNIADSPEQNKQNVTARFMAILDERTDNISVSAGAINGEFGGEEGEVEMIGWIPLSKLDEYEWAFNHKQIIKEYYNGIVDWS